MVRAFIPTEADKRILDDLVRSARDKRNNAPSQIPSSEIEDDIQSPDVYIALPPSGGIPALTRVGTAGVAGEGDTPGNAIAAIYRLTLDGTLVPITPFTQKVYNLSTNEILEDWILVTKTKFGFWIADAPSEIQVKEGILQANLLGATDAASNPSTANLKVFQQPATGTGGLEFSGEIITITNRFTEILQIDVGSWLVAIRINEEWRPIAADCGASTVV